MTIHEKGGHTDRFPAKAVAAIGVICLAVSYSAGWWNRGRSVEEDRRNNEARIQFLSLDWQEQNKIKPAMTSVTVTGVDIGKASSRGPCDTVHILEFPKQATDSQLGDGKQFGLARWRSSEPAEVALIGSADRLATGSDMPGEGKESIDTYKLGVLSCTPQTIGIVAIGPTGEPSGMMGIGITVTPKTLDQIGDGRNGLDHIPVV